MRHVTVVQNAWRRYGSAQAAREAHPSAVWLDACSASPAFIEPMGAAFCRSAVDDRRAGLATFAAGLRYRIDVVNWGSETDPLPPFWEPGWCLTLDHQRWWRSASVEFEAHGRAWPAGSVFARKWFSELATRIYFGTAAPGTLPIVYDERSGVLCDIRMEGYRAFAVERLLRSLAACHADAVMVPIKTSDQAKRWPLEEPRHQDWTPYSLAEWNAAWGAFVWQLHDAGVRVVTIEQQPDEKDWGWADPASRSLLVGEYVEA